MAGHRLEITLRPEVLARLDEARGHEPRASFVKRALESALGDGLGREAARSHPSTPASSRAPVEKESAGGASAEKQKPRAASTASSASSRRAPSIKDTWRR